MEETYHWIPRTREVKITAHCRLSCEAKITPHWTRKTRKVKITSHWTRRTCRVNIIVRREGNHKIQIFKMNQLWKITNESLLNQFPSNGQERPRHTKKLQEIQGSYGVSNGWKSGHVWFYVAMPRFASKQKQENVHVGTVETYEESKPLSPMNS